MDDQGTFVSKLLEGFALHSKEKIVEKNDFLIRQGEIEKYAYLIHDGLVRVFYVSGAEESTIRFGYKNSFINSLSSFFTGEPSEFYAQAVRKTRLSYIHKDSFREMVYKDETSLRGWSQMLESLVTQQIEREIDLLIPSPSERLQRVLQRSPQLFQEVPLKYIASYLRMTPETLSRIRYS